MRMRVLWALAGWSLMAAARAADPYARSADQAVDAAYGAAIARYTTDPSFQSPLTAYLPASDTVPTPAAVLGDVAGAPNMLPYAADVHRYFRMLAEKSPRVRVFRIGTTEEGREIIAAAIADEQLITDLDANRESLALLGDPRRLQLDDARADAMIAQAAPVYYITGSIHSTETGSPTALMELAYRLAVDDAPYIREIRSRVITLITPVVEVDGRERMVDLYRWHRAHPGNNYPPLMYWGHYVAHDNNRDAMTLTLALTRSVLDTYVAWNAQVLHDLHESVPFLYDNTVGDTPYNAWIDPILTNEWQMIGWNNVQAMTRYGMPGVFAHGDFDTWTPGYLMFIAASRNGISRLYETFGNGGADTVERILDPQEYSRTWYRPNPPWPKVLWSQRNNNNYQQTGLLTSLKYFADNRDEFVHNFWLKSKRSITKPADAGPAAYVLSADEPRRELQARLLRLLQAQHVEISRASKAFSVPAPSKDDRHAKRRFPAGSYLVRMDQPYSRIADMLLDTQYWAPDEPQKHPYDDTGWTLGPLFGVEVLRVTDPAVLQTPMEPAPAPLAPDGGADGGGAQLIANRGEPGLASLAFRRPGRELRQLSAPYRLRGQTYPAGSLVASADDALDADLEALGLAGERIGRLSDAPTRPLRLPRIALMHTWLDTQTEGWWRQALDQLQLPYQYISTQDLAAIGDLKSRFDAILFAPIGGIESQQIVDGLPMWGNALPWKRTALTPNIGTIDATDDIRPGMGEAGLAALKRFVAAGGLLVTAEDTARFAIAAGLAPGVRVADGEGVKVHGSVLQARRVGDSPVANGYGERFAIYSSDGMAFQIASVVAGRGPTTADDAKRTTGRGSREDADQPQGRKPVAAEPLPDPEPWEAPPLDAERRRNNPLAIPPEAMPQVAVRFGDAEELLVSGLLDGGDKLAGRPVVVVARYGQGHVLLFAGNPIWRGETLGEYALVFNALLNHDALTPPPSKPAQR